jgi:hypothetical protein
VVAKRVSRRAAAAPPRTPTPTSRHPPLPPPTATTAEQVIGPAYAKLGETVAFGTRKTHPELMQMLATIEAQAVALAAAAGKLTSTKPGYTPSADDKAATAAAFVPLKASWAEFLDFMVVHLGEEERVIPRA